VQCLLYFISVIFELRLIFPRKILQILVVHLIYLSAQYMFAVPWFPRNSTFSEYTIITQDRLQNGLHAWPVLFQIPFILFTLWPLTFQVLRI